MAESEPAETWHGHESSDVHGRPIAMIGVLVVLTALLAVGGLLLLRHLQTSGLAPSYETPSERGTVTSVPPAPRLQPNTTPDIRAIREEERTLLHGGYHWINRDAGTVRMPIQRAMELVVNAAHPSQSKQGKE